MHPAFAPCMGAGINARQQRQPHRTAHAPDKEIINGDATPNGWIGTVEVSAPVKLPTKHSKKGCLIPVTVPSKHQAVNCCLSTAMRYQLLDRLTNLGMPFRNG